MNRRILWCITGAAYPLRQLVEFFRNFVNRYRIELAVCFSNAGYEVARIYGVLDKIEGIVSKSRYGGMYTQTSSSGYPLIGRIALGIYDVVVIAPMTSNTMAKIVHGIADTLPTMVFSQALKASIPTILLPSDYAEKCISELPCRIKHRPREIQEIDPSICPYNAIKVDVDRGDIYIDYSLCRGCEICAKKYPSIFSCWDRIEVTPSVIDLENLRKLEILSSRCRTITIVKSVDELEKALKEFLRIE